MEIQQSMLRSYHAFANSHLLISVTFSTPTPDYINCHSTGMSMKELALDSAGWTTIASKKVTGLFEVKARRTRSQ
jgi:hypothetical protein